MVTEKSIDLTISQSTYEKYLSRKHSISNDRLRPENQDFLDAIMSVDMSATSEGRDILNAIKKLN